MYLSEIFYWLLSMSITSAFCALPVLIMRCIPKIPKNVVRHLWMIPFLRFILPVGLPTKHGFMELTAKLTKTVAVPVGTLKDTRFLAYNHVHFAEKYIPFTWKTDTVRKIFEIASIVWLSVCIVLVLIFLLVYIKTVLDFRNKQKDENDIYFSNKTTSPFLLGIIKPKIIMPIQLKGKNNKYIICHEKNHIKSFDNFSRVLAVTVCCVHWFNPLVWIMLKLFICDLEIACDERTIKNYSTAEKKEYAMTLINPTRSPTSIFSNFGASPLFKRVDKILSFKKLSAFALVCITVLFILVCYVLLSNPDIKTI